MPRKRKAKATEEEINAGSSEVEQAAEAAAEPPREEPQSDTQTAPPPEQETAQQAGPPLDVYNLARWVISIMASSAWQYMGLQPNPGTGQIEKDLNQARIAIDTVVFLGDKIAPHLGEDERREIRNLISDLQINFVQHRE